MGNVILVAGHAVLRNTDDVFADSSWFLLDFQRGEAGCYVGHVRCGVELAALDPEALLIFTGGRAGSKPARKVKPRGTGGSPRGSNGSDTLQSVLAL